MREAGCVCARRLSRYAVKNLTPITRLVVRTYCPEAATYLIAENKKRTRNVKIDRHNLKILDVLQTNARISNLNLADQIGLSESACLARVKKLTSEKFIREFQAEVNLEKVRHAEFYVNVALKRQDSKTSESFRRAINKIEQIVSCVKMSGEFDYMLRFVCPDAADFNRVSEQLLADEDAAITRMTSHLVIEKTKPFTGYPLELLFQD